MACVTCVPCPHSQFGRTGEHVGERVEHGLRVQARGQRLVLRREGGQRVLPPGRQLPADDRVQLPSLLRAGAQVLGFGKQCKVVL